MQHNRCRVLAFIFNFFLLAGKFHIFTLLQVVGEYRFSVTPSDVFFFFKCMCVCVGVEGAPTRVWKGKGEARLFVFAFNLTSVVPFLTTHANTSTACTNAVNLEVGPIR